MVCSDFSDLGILKFAPANLFPMAIQCWPEGRDNRLCLPDQDCGCRRVQPSVNTLLNTQQPQSLISTQQVLPVIERLELYQCGAKCGNVGRDQPTA
jgi:hypothetical protein